jgi:MYXO-CTERM domain-containing protein
MKKLAIAAIFAVVMFPFAVQAQQACGEGTGHACPPDPGGSCGYGTGHSCSGQTVTATEMPYLGTVAAGLIGLGGYLVLRRRHLQSQ